MIVVTGANGFIGSALTRFINEKSESSILAVDSVSREERPEPLNKSNIKEFLLKDEWIQNMDSIHSSESISCVFHMGACSSTTETNWEFLKENNTDYTQRIFEFCTKSNIPLIYASSAATYGDGENGFDDQTPSSQLRALNLYGKSKLIFDEWAEKQDETPNHWYGVKFFNVYGPNEYHKGPMASVVFKAFHQIKETGELKLFRSHRDDYRDGEQKRDFVYIKEVCQWMWDLYENKPSSGIYNMGSGQAKTWLDLAHAVFKAMKKEAKIHWIDIPENIRNQYQYFTEAKMEKLFSSKVTQNQWPLEKGVEDYIVNHLVHPDPFY